MLVHDWRLPRAKDSCWLNSTEPSACCVWFLLLLYFLLLLPQRLLDTQSCLYACQVCVCVRSLANEKLRNRTAFTRNIIIIYWPIECNVPTLSNNKCVHLCIDSCVAVCATRTRHPAITSHITECQKCIFTFLNDYHRKKIYENKIKSIVRSVSMSGDSFLVGRIFKQS